MTIKEIEEDVKKTLSEKRFKHSIRNNENGKRTCSYLWRRRK